MSRGGISLVRAAIAVVIVLVVVAAVFVFVWSPFTTSNKNTTSTVSPAANLVAFVQPTPQTACAGQPFSNTSLSINWGNLAPGTEGIQYLCLKNAGTAPISVAVASTLSTSIGRVTSPQAGTTLNGNGIIQVELDLWVSSNVQPGPISAFTITVGAKT
jgi:hypothetical protein